MPGHPPARGALATTTITSHRVRTIRVTDPTHAAAAGPKGHLPRAPISLPPGFAALDRVPRGVVQRSSSAAAAVGSSLCLATRLAVGASVLLCVAAVAVL